MFMMTHRKMVALPMKNLRPFFSPAISSIWPTRNEMTASRKFWPPLGMSFIERVQSQAMMMMTAITTHEVRSVFVILSGPIAVSFSAGTIISGWGPWAMKRPTARNASTPTTAPAMVKAFTQPCPGSV